MSELSVESRLKAHISTPFIDADGRGTRDTYTKDFAACMLDPAAFRERERGEGLEQHLLATLEAREQAVVLRNEDRSAASRAVVAERVAQSNAASVEVVGALVAKRADDREVDREADTSEHYNLYQRRNESAIAQRAFEESLKPSAEAKVRDREESVSRRHRELMALRQRANTSQSQAIRQDRDRKAAAEALGEANLAKKLSEQAEVDRRQLHEAAREEYEGIVRERERQTQLRRLEEDVRLKQEVQFMMWQRDRDEAMANAQRLAEIATEAQATFHAAEMSSHTAVANGSYEAMKALHAQLERLSHSLSIELLKANRHGSCLNMLMAVAKEKACERGTPFRGLLAVCKGTLVPTVYTPTVLPVPDKSHVTIACQTNVSEPIRAVPQQKGRRI